MVLIGQRIKKLRKTARYTQTELASLLGVTKSTIAAYENDSRLPSCDVLIKIGGVFKISIDSLLLNRSEKILDAEGLDDDQLALIENLIVRFREANQMSRRLERYAAERENLGRGPTRFPDYGIDPDLSVEK